MNGRIVVIIVSYVPVVCSLQYWPVINTLVTPLTFGSTLFYSTQYLNVC